MKTTKIIAPCRYKFFLEQQKTIGMVWDYGD